jgi:hypothetical protein
MTRRRIALTATAVLLSGIALTGCSQASDAVRDATGAVASSAASQAADIARDAARDQVCRITSDGQISAGESTALTAAVDAAEAAGVPTSFTDPARTLAEQGENAPQSAVTELQEQCGSATPTP